MSTPCPSRLMKKAFNTIKEYDPPGVLDSTQVQMLLKCIKTTPMFPFYLPSRAFAWILLNTMTSMLPLWRFTLRFPSFFPQSLMSVAPNALFINIFQFAIHSYCFNHLMLLFVSISDIIHKVLMDH